MNFDSGLHHARLDEPKPINMTPLPVQIPSLQDTYGALFIGMCFCILLYGLTLHQTYLYFRFFHRDQSFLKVVVFAILIVETLHTIMITHICYDHLVINYFNPLGLLSDTWSLRLLAPISVVAMTLCQGFYTRRVYLIERRYRPLVALAIALLVAEFGFMVALTVQAFKGQNVEDLGNLTWLVSAIYGLAVSIDSIVTGVLIAALLRSKTGFKRTDSLIQTLVVYTINTGLSLSIAGILCFVFALVMPETMIYVAIGVVTTKLYANSVLAVLNARRSLSEGAALDGFRTDTLQFGGNLQPMMASSVVLGQRSSRLVTVSLPAANGDEHRSSERGMGSESDVGSAPAAEGDNKF
ncbi:hypothetical protein GY45DRAFT_1438640 [Cubamyces sp. BRFM 1775]|nr:hypothetical protein GY45DRAFT_1438640 [Cubamyces sp. BRFM 1775]